MGNLLSQPLPGLQGLCLSAQSYFCMTKLIYHLAPSLCILSGTSSLGKCKLARTKFMYKERQKNKNFINNVMVNT